MRTEWDGERVDLYAKSKATGKLMRWSIWQEEDEIVMEYGQVDGEIQERYEKVPYGMGGRTLQDQINLRVNSRINKKKDKGYVEDKQKALEDNRTNSLGYVLPMKAAPVKSVSDVPFGELYVQKKYNGHRCMIINDNGENIAYSSNGKLIETIPEIVNSIEIPEGVTLDGELYHHGTALQTISSWVRRRQESTKNLQFVCFDAVVDLNFHERFSMLQNEFEWNDRVVLADTALLIGEFDILALLKRTLEDGYEGLMLRHGDSPYLDGQRSKKAIRKVKRNVDESFVLDDEFLVVNILESNDGWARLVCETFNGQTFNVSAPGSIEEKTEVYRNRANYIGKHVRVEFFEYTKSRVPFHPVAIEWREKHEE